MPAWKFAGLCSTPSISVPSVLFQVTTSCDGCGQLLDAVTLVNPRCGECGRSLAELAATEHN